MNGKKILALNTKRFFVFKIFKLKIKAELSKIIKNNMKREFVNENLKFILLDFDKINISKEENIITDIFIPGSKSMFIIDSMFWRAPKINNAIMLSEYLIIKIANAAIINGAELNIEIINNYKSTGFIK